MELFKLLGKIAVENTDANKAIDETVDKASNSQSKLVDGLGKFGKVMAAVGGIAASALVTGGAAVVSLTKNAVEAYGDYEQLVGGSQLLFGDAYDFIADKAANAYKTVQMSQSDYLQQVNGFAVGLKTALGGNEKAAAQLADRILTAEADVVAATGNSQEAVQNAFNGIMKSNYTMLDNLQLGIKPTKEGMQEVIDKVNEWNTANGNATSYQIDNLADCQSALVDYIEMQGLAGYAANEALDTIQGSMSSAKAAWQNLVVGMADDTQNFDSLMDNFVDSVMAVGKNIIPRVETTLSGVGKLITGFAEKLAPQVIGMLPSLVEGLLPKILDAATAMADAILGILPGIVSALVAVVPQLVNAIATLIPQLINVGMDIVIALLDGITQVLPQIVVSIVELIPQIIDALLGCVPDLLNAAIQLLLAIVDAIPDIASALSAALPQIINTIVTTLVAAIPQLITGAIQLLMAICEAIPQVLPPLIEALPQIIDGIVTGLLAAQEVLLDGALQLLMAIVDAIPLMLDKLMPQLSEIVSTIVSSLIAKLPTLIQGSLELFLGLVTGFSQMIPSLVAALPKVISALISGLTAPVKGLFQGLWDGIKSIFAPIVGWFADKFNSVKEKMTAPVEKAKETIKGIVDKISGFFSGANFSFPHIKLPHFSVSPSGWKVSDLLQGSIPKLGISWYARAMDNGLIMDKPTIFGVNGDGNLMAGGEAGSETVVGTNSLMNMIQKAVNNAFEGNTRLLELILAELKQIDNTFADKLCEALKSLGIEWDERELARLVRKYT